MKWPAEAEHIVRLGPVRLHRLPDLYRLTVIELGRVVQTRIGYVTRLDPHVLDDVGHEWRKFHPMICLLEDETMFTPAIANEPSQ